LKLSCEADGNRSQLARKKSEEDCKHESDLTMAGEMIERDDLLLSVTNRLLAADEVLTESSILHANDR
jgi:hypothetical protein